MSKQMSASVTYIHTVMGKVCVIVIQNARENMNAHSNSPDWQILICFLFVCLRVYAQCKGFYHIDLSNASRMEAFQFYGLHSHTVEMYCKLRTHQEWRLFITLKCLTMKLILNGLMYLNCIYKKVFNTRHNKQTTNKLGELWILGNIPSLIFICFTEAWSPVSVFRCLVQSTGQFVSVLPVRSCQALLYMTVKS